MALKETKKEDIASYKENSLDNAQDDVFYSSELYVLLKKTERIARAAHLITRHISDVEPVRKRIRGSAITLFSVVLKVAHTTHLRQEDIVQSALSEFVGVLRMGRDSGLISGENYTIMHHACVACAKDLRAHLKKTEGEGLSGFFEMDVVKEEGKKDIGTDIHRHYRYKGQNRSDGDASSNTIDERQKGYAQDKGHVSQQLSKDDRQVLIKNIVSRKGRVTIKDISAIITDCSEKTLQRDVQDLLAKDVLKKEGSRRWSTYLLAQE